MPKNLIQKLKEELINLKIYPEDKIGVGFSAGPDSTFLLCALKELNYKHVYPFYINYHDSDEVDKEEALVKKLCKNLKYPVKIYELTRHLKGNFESAAREFRYREFAKFQADLKLKGILIAHQQDDNIVTYLMQKERKCASYCGLKPFNLVYNAKIYRPMLNISKQEIISYLDTNEIPYYQDKTNRNLKRTRNNYVINILPTLDRNEALKEMDRINFLLKEIQANAKSAIISLDYYNQLSEINKLYFLRYYLIYRHFDKNKAVKLTKVLYYILKKKNETDSYCITGDNFLYLNHKSAFISKPFLCKYSLTVTKSNLEASQYFFKVDLREYQKYYIKESDFPLKIEPPLNNDTFSRGKFEGKDVASFIKKEKVVSYLRPYYPVIKNREGNVIYVPRYKEILNSTSFIHFIFNCD